MHWITKPGTSHTEMWRITAQACRELLTIPGVRNCGSHIGQAMSADEPYGIYFTENWISVDPSVDYDATLSKVQEMVDGYPGLIRDVQTYLKERIREVLTGSSDTVVVRIYGPELEELRSTADKVLAALEGIEGIADLKKEAHVDVAQVDITVDLAAAQRYGLKPGDIRRATAFLLQGEEVGDIYVGGKTYDVNVWSTPETRKSLTNIRELLIDTPAGGHVRLADVADVRIVPAPNVIEREGQSARLTCRPTARTRPRRRSASKPPLNSVPADLRVFGEYAERRRPREFTPRGLSRWSPFLMLYTSFRLAPGDADVLHPALGAGGRRLAAYFTGGVLSLGSSDCSRYWGLRRAMGS
jgi:Cu/Ag efflux pump CusA